MEVIFIEWVDSYGALGGWHGREDLCDPVLNNCFTVGYFLHEDDQLVQVAQSYSPETKNTIEQVNGIIVIPKVAIVHMERLGILGK